MKKPAKMLPMASRLIGLIIVGSFSFMFGEKLNRGLLSNAKKMIRVL